LRILIFVYFKYIVELKQLQKIIESYNNEIMGCDMIYQQDCQQLMEEKSLLERLVDRLKTRKIYYSVKTPLRWG
jgi:hypothetical protein